MYDVPAERQFTPREIARARSLGERLQPDVFQSVLQYGLYAQVRLAGIADEVMSRLDQTADDRSEFVRLLRRMRRLDPARRRPYGLRQLLPTFRRGPKNEDTLLDRYDRLCHRLDRMLPALESSGRLIGETLARFDLLYERNQTYLEELDVLVYGARMRLEELEQDAAAVCSDDAVPTGSQLDRRHQLERQVERVEQRIVDLQATADTARETGPTIRRIQDDLRSLLLEGQFTSLNTATRWKHRFAAAVTRARQVEARAAVRDGRAGVEDKGKPVGNPADDERVATDSPALVLAPTNPGAATSTTADEQHDPRGLSRLVARVRTWRGAVRRARDARDDDDSVFDLWWG